MKTTRHTDKRDTRIITALLFLSAALFFSTPAKAQRTAEHQMLFSASVTTQSFSGLGGEVSWGRYLRFAYWNAGLFLKNPSVPVSAGGSRLTFSHLAPYGSFMFRIVGTPTRLFSLYGGADAFFGLEVMDMYAQLTSEAYSVLINSGYTPTRFIYGGGLRLEAEIFLLPFVKSLALTAHGRLGLTGNSGSKQVFGYELGVGLRYNY